MSEPSEAAVKAAMTAIQEFREHSTNPYAAELARVALSAALPLIEANLRERIATEIEAGWLGDDFGEVRNAARVVREGGQP